MLNADKELLLSNLKQNSLALREKELNFFNENFAAVGTQVCGVMPLNRWQLSPTCEQAALIAGFSMTALAELGVPEDTPRFSKVTNSSLHCAPRCVTCCRELRATFV